MVAALIPLAAAAIPAIASFFSNRSSDEGDVASRRSSQQTPIQPPIQPPVHVTMPGPAVPPVHHGQTLVTSSGHVVPISNHPMAQHTARVGRAEVNRVNSQLNPMLQEILSNQRTRANQIQATAEHRQIVDQQNWRDDVVRRLQRIEGDVMHADVGGSRRSPRSSRY
jgi:hypothetical protein